MTLRERLRGLIDRWLILRVEGEAGTLDDFIRELRAALSAPDETEEALRGLVAELDKIDKDYGGPGQLPCNKFWPALACREPRRCNRTNNDQATRATKRGRGEQHD